MRKIINLEYKSVIKYLILFSLFVLLNNLQKEVAPYSTAFLGVALAFNNSIILTPILYLCSLLVFGKTGLMMGASITSLFLALVSIIYRKFKIRIRYEIVLFTALSLIPYLLIGDTTYEIALEDRIFCALITLLICFFAYLSAHVLTVKGLKYKLGYEEFASLGVIIFALSLGICNLISPLVWQGVAIFTILLLSFTYKKGAGTVVAGVFGVSLAVYFGNISYISLFILYSLLAQSLITFNRYASAFLVVLGDYLVQVIFNFYSVYLLENFLCILIGAVVFCIIPTSPLLRLKEKLYAFREKQLTRVAINRNRLLLSNKLFELSGVFSEMSEAFNSFKKSAIGEQNVKKAIKNEILSSVCKECPNKNKCSTSQKEFSLSLDSLIDIGFAKGKLSLIDLPKNLGDKCIHPNNILFCANKLLASYRSYLTEHINLENGRNLIATETAGVSEILRGLALESGTVLKYQSKMERVLSDNLLKNGFMISELLIYGEQENLSIGLIITQKEFSLDKLLRVIKNTLKRQMMLVEKTTISEEKCYLSFTRTLNYDAVFGVASATKDLSEQSGDTHSVTKISKDKFLIALSDGMGSGEEAQNISSVSLSLIESFYKAGMNSDLILNTVNKLLSVNTEDSFTALDIAVINLNTCQADFIKYGSPYGFIVGEEGIKILEGNTLPLGILEQLNPSVCSVKLNANDVVVFVSDGVSDAFGSSAEVIDFMRTVAAKNPQTLADDILNKSIELSNGEKKDDMTVLCVRVYKNAV